MNTSLSAHPINWQHPFNRDLEFWAMNLPLGLHGGGNTFRDLAGRNPGTLSGGMGVANWVGAKGRPGGWGALDFAGTAAREHVNAGDVLHFPNDFTISFWVFKREATVGNSSLWGVARWNTGSAPGTNEYVIVLGGGDDDFPGFLIEVGTTNYSISADKEIVLNRWTHMCGVRRGANIEIYMDGIEAATPVVASASPIQDRGRNFKIADSDLVNRAFNSDALFDDIRGSKRALSAQEVRALYDESRAGYPNALNWVRRPRAKAPAVGVNPTLLQVTNAYRGLAA